MVGLLRCAPAPMSSFPSASKNVISLREGTWPPPADGNAFSRHVHSPHRSRRRSSARGPRTVSARTAAVHGRLRARCALNSPRGGPSSGTGARPAAGQFSAGGPSACRTGPRPVAGPRRTDRCTCGNQPAIRLTSRQYLMPHSIEPAPTAPIERVELVVAQLPEQCDVEGSGVAQVGSRIDDV